MSKAAQKTVLHNQTRKSNFEGSLDHALDILKECGRVEGEVKIDGIVKQGTTIMKVARELYSKNEKTMLKNQMTARLAWVEGWNEGVGADIGARKSTKPEDNAKQADKIGVWIRAGVAFEDASDVEPFVARLKSTIGKFPLTGDDYVSLPERILKVLRVIAKDHSKAKMTDREMVLAIKPDPLKLKEAAENRALKKKQREDAAKIAEDTAKTAAPAPAVAPAGKNGGKASDFDALVSATEYFANMAVRFEKEHPALKARLEKAAMEIALIAEELKKEEETSKAKAEKTVEAIKEDARKGATSKESKAKPRTKRGK